MFQHLFSFAKTNVAAALVVLFMSAAVGHSQPGASSGAASTQRRVVAFNLNIPDDSAPVWTADGRTLIVCLNRDPYGLVAFDLIHGEFRRLLSEKPQLPHETDSTTICHTPLLVGERVFCRLNMRFDTPGGIGSYHHWVSVPVGGGPAAPIFSSEMEQMVGFMQKQYLMVGRSRGERAVFGLPMDDPRDVNAALFAALPEPAGERVVLDRSASVLATADWRQPWRLYTITGKPIVTLPEAFGRWLALRQDGAWAAGEYFENSRRAGIAIAPVSPDSRPLLVDTRGVTFGLPSWSPDGRYLAYRAFQGNEREELVILDLQPQAGPSLAEGGVLFERGRHSLDGRRVTPTPVTVSIDSKAMYDAYIEAYNALTSLMAAGKGNTDEGKAAYAAYEKAKRAYEAAIGAQPEEKH